LLGNPEFIGHAHHRRIVQRTYPHHPPALLLRTTISLLIHELDKRQKTGASYTYGYPQHGDHQKQDADNDNTDRTASAESEGNHKGFHLHTKSTKTRLWAPSLRRGGEEIVNSLSATIIHRTVTYLNQVNT
jgi:hypothetical protein